jgi:Na+/melibiose symporter-like transporter
MLVSQNLILMGVFFTVPLFLQIVQGLDALETGVRMLPASVGLFVSAVLGSALSKRFPARTLVRVGLTIAFVSTLLLLDTVDTTLDDTAFLVAMGVLGVGMGLIVSQLGNVVQSAVADEERSEAGGLQNTAAQLGSSLGTALLGAIVISGLIFAFTANVASNPRVSADVHEQVEVRVAAGASFVESAQVEAAAKEAGVPPATATALVDDYENAQITALKTAFLCAALLVLASFFATRGLPTKRFDVVSAAAGSASAAPSPGPPGRS